MKKLPALIFFTALIVSGKAQVNVGIAGGANLATIVETNSLPNWSMIKKNYKWLQGFQGGVFADIPLNRKSTFVFEPEVIYFNKGRKYFQQFDSTVITGDSSFKQKLNYIDIPFNLLLKFHLGGKVNFVIGGGPYVSFFFNGSEKSVTNFKDPATYPSVTTTNSDLPVGKAPGKYTTMDYGATATIGFEMGKVFLRATGSKSLADMYQAKNYKGSFKNQVISVSLGVMLATINVPVEKKKLPDSTKATAKTKKLKDRDGDGVPDIYDRCPDVKGVASNYGCPLVDTDGDGIPDNEDKCPAVKGTLKYHGCPPPDTDSDGIPDDEDQCPTVPGLLRYHGCPIPDTDGDGLNDEIDHCPTVPGLRSNNGCPADTTHQLVITNEILERLKTATRKIQFSYNRSDLLPSSFESLDEVVKILNNGPSDKLKIEGHASIEGRYELNMKLSEDRAIAVKNYLVSKGIDAGRLSTIGYGSARLLTIAQEQQAINRRVEMKLYY